MDKDFRVVASFDTETTTLKNGDSYQAFVCLYIFNDLRDVVDFRSYVPDVSDNIKFFRYENESLLYINELINWGIENDTIPVVAAYNLSFDLQTLKSSLSSLYNIHVNAQSSSNIYTYDLCADDDGKNILLRFWDTFFLDMRGLAKMGETAGLKKAVGDWDYELIRSPETPLTDRELFYAGRDTQVIPAYLKYLLDSNEWMKSGDFGVRILTKTSIVRQMAKKVIGCKSVMKANGKKIKLGLAFKKTCEQEFPADYETYALRKACFRGGLTFTAANTAATIQHRVCSLDVTSMHHTFITGSRVPVHFIKSDPNTLTYVANMIINESLDYVLAHYDEPFWLGFNGLVEFRNVSLKNSTVFYKSGIATLAEGKFYKKAADAGWDDERAHIAQDSVSARGWHDMAGDAIFAFGKLYKASRVRCFLTEIELWIVSKVYSFDDMSVIKGEYTTHFIVPPDYVTLQTNILFSMKNDAKKINNTYREGEPYTLDIPESIPNAIAEKVKSGEMSNHSFEAWYTGNVKGMFNSIYGTQAQDLMKPEYASDEFGDLYVDTNTVTNPDNYNDKLPNNIKVFYNYGSRIVGRSRMHLVIAMILIDRAFGSNVRILGGDTDSMKISLDDCVCAEDLIDALKPLHTATRRAISDVQSRVRRLFPNLASELKNVGMFDIEYADKSTGSIYYDEHYEAWNKARVSIVNGKSHITCAGLPRPEGKYNVENLIDDLVSNGNKFSDVAPLVLGYNTTFDNSVCHTLERTSPKASDIFDSDVTDYLGNKTHVRAHMAQALYSVDRVVGDTLKFTNAANVSYLKSIVTEVSTKMHVVGYDGAPYIQIGYPYSEEVVR